MIVIFVCESYVETSLWSAEEVEAYQQAVMEYDKDFFLISKQVKFYMYLCLFDYYPANATTSSWPHLRCDVDLEEGEYK